jgi:signal transduction histidine kinase
VAFAGLAAGARAALQAHNVEIDDFRSWLRDEFRVSRSYFISHKHPFSRLLPAGYVADLGRRQEWEWHPDDVLLVPLHDGRGELLGYFSVDDPADRLVPSQEAVELLEVFGNHAVVAIENARLYRQLAQRTRELEEADRRMKEMDELKSQFVSTVSHELRTPLTAIRAYTDALLATGVAGVPPERLQEFLQVVDEEAQRLSRLIESVLDLGRFDSGNRRARRRPVDLQEVVTEAIGVLSMSADARQVELKAVRGLADTQLDADRDQLRQLVLHLGTNAVKFTPPGGLVTLKMGGNEESVTLEVEDTGIGIPEEALEKIFDRFYQVDSTLARRYGGSGLGLAICKSIAEWHGGRVTAQSTPGRGSCFTVVLPRHGGPRVSMRPASGLSAATSNVLRLGVEMVSEVMDAGLVSLMSAGPDGHLLIQAAVGLEAHVIADTRVRPGLGVSGWVAENRRPVCAKRADGGAVPGSGRRQYQTGTFLSVPLEGHEQFLGVLNVTDPTSQQPFQIEDCHLLLELAEAIAFAWRGALAADALEAGAPSTSEALRTGLEHVRRSRQRAPERVRLARGLAQEMGLTDADAALIAFAATMHDAGRVKLARETLEGSETKAGEPAGERPSWPGGMPGQDETAGAGTLDRLRTMSAVREIVMSSHEWWDGTGYPRALRGSAIPAGARVLAVVDAYLSLTGRAQDGAPAPESAVEEIRRLRGKQFDPDVVGALERTLSRPGAGAGVPAGLTAASDSRR